jgi:formyl-CoA transferase
MAEVGGYDLACGWATSGMAFKMTRDGPLPQPPAFFDLQGANTLAGAIGMALFKRARTGETSVIDVSLMHVAMWAMSPDIVGAPALGDIADYGDRAQAPNPIVNVYATNDGRFFYLVCLQPDRFWAELCGCIGRSDLATDERFVDGPSRFQNRVACVAELDADFGAMDLAEVQRRLADFTGVWAPVLRPSELHTHPQVEANGYLPTVAGGDGDPFRLVAAPMHLSGYTTAPRATAPQLGQHTEEVLLETGLDWAAISALRAAGALG